MMIGRIATTLIKLDNIFFYIIRSKTIKSINIIIFKKVELRFK